MTVDALQSGRTVPPFEAESTAGPFRSDDQRGRTLVLFFYPKDGTPGCTTETREFGEATAAFAEAGAVVFGLSRDTIKSHLKFKEALGITLELISDPDETVCRLFDVMKTKNMYGKQVRGVERSTFVIDAAGVLVAEWRGVKVPGHVDEVLAAVRARRASAASPGST